MHGMCGCSILLESGGGETNIPLKKLLKVKDSFATHFLVLFDYHSNPPLEIIAKYTCTCQMNIKASQVKQHDVQCSILCLIPRCKLYHYTTASSHRQAPTPMKASTHALYFQTYAIYIPGKCPCGQK